MTLSVKSLSFICEDLSLDRQCSYKSQEQCECVIWILGTERQAKLTGQPALTTGEWEILCHTILHQWKFLPQKKKKKERETQRDKTWSGFYSTAAWSWRLHLREQAFGLLHLCDLVGSTGEKCTFYMYLYTTLEGTVCRWSRTGHL